MNIEKFIRITTNLTDENKKALVLVEKKISAANYSPLLYQYLEKIEEI
ncbi:hypothetical protein [Proteiniphilum propionicum]|nr:hypothetical protein [Proteiniphilum propionicum]ULB35755.1 hypothetical protein KDN43_06950 [Proteiniphilum propionicum]